LELYLAEDLNRRRTATAPHLHPSTVDYRLRRVVALTGLDPARPRTCGTSAPQWQHAG
jgi:sugar diacid utilization regulator